MRFASLLFQKAAVEIFDQIGAAPVELRSHRGHEGGHESGKQDSQECVRCLVNGHQHEAALGLRQIRIQNNRHESGENPEPRAARRSASFARSWGIPPTARTPYQATEITMAIFKTN